MQSEEDIDNDQIENSADKIMFQMEKDLEEASQKTNNFGLEGDIKLDDQQNEEDNSLPNESDEIGTEESDEVDENPEVKKPKKDLNVTKQIRKYQNEKYKARAETEEWKERYKQLEAKYADTANSGIYHYEKNIDSEIERAKEDRIKALETGDSIKLNETDIALMRAMIRKEELEKEKYYNQQQPQQQYEQPEQNQQPTLQQEILYDWLESHPYLQPSARSYDANLAQQVNNFAKQLDDKLQRSKRTDLYYSDEYFNYIDNFIERSRNKPQTNTNGNASRSNASVGSVRNSYSYDGVKPSKPSVEADEMDLYWVQNTGGMVTKEGLLRQKQKLQKERNR